MTEIQGVVDLLNALGVASLFGPLIGLILSIWILKKTVFAGWGELVRQLISGFFTTERERIQVQTEVGATLQEIAKQLESLTKKVSDELKESTERLRTLEIVMSDYFDHLRELKESLDEKPCLVERKA